MCGLLGDVAWFDIRCVATDNGSSFDTALNTVLPGVPRILCLYHIDENLKRKLTNKLGSEYGVFHKAWSRLVGCTQTEADFELLWAKLMTTYPAASEYLQTWVYPNKELWCHVWTRRYTTFGARTTQRCESVNNVIKYMMERNGTLETLFKTVLSVSERWAEKRNSRVLADQYTNHDCSGPDYTDAVQHLTREAARLVFKESLHMNSYSIHYFDNLPLECSASLYGPSTIRAKFKYHFGVALSQQSYDGVSTGFSQSQYSFVVPEQSTASLGAAIPQSSHSQQTVRLQSNHSLTEVDIQSTANPAPHTATDVHHPHSTLDIPGESGAYYVRHRNATKGDITHWVRVREGSATCTDCEFNTNHLLPCRHILAVNHERWLTASSEFQPGQCHRRWWLHNRSIPHVLPSIDAIHDPTSHDSPSLSDDDTSTTLSHDRICIEWIASCQAATGFIQSHGEAGLLYAQNTLKKLIKELSARAGGVRQPRTVSQQLIYSLYTVNTQSIYSPVTV